jgi:hypothetical protein
MKRLLLNLPKKDFSDLAALAIRKNVNKTFILRKALRLYQLLYLKSQGGEKLVFETSEGKRGELVILGLT